MTPAGFTISVLRQLRTVRRQVPTSVFQSLIVALVLSRLDYCNSVRLPANLIQRLQSVQNAAAGLISRIWRSEHITPALISPHWLRVPESIYFKLSVMTYRSVLGTSTVMFHPRFRHNIQTTTCFVAFKTLLHYRARVF